MIMSDSSNKNKKNVVFEGWLTKSPPTKRIWRTKWRRRWFALRQSGDLPGQYFLDYYEDRHCRRLKGSINLDLCEQVDAGLHMDRGTGTLGPKVRGSVFSIQTSTRVYHLEADSDVDMEKWVDTICRVCGLRATNETTMIGTYSSVPNGAEAGATAEAEQEEGAEGTGPYIRISECITGPRSQECFTFDPKNIVTSQISFEKVSTRIYLPNVRVISDLSENESNLSEDEAKSTTTSQPNARAGVGKSFTKLAINSKKDGKSPILGADGKPPVPPRPPKTFKSVKSMQQKDPYQGPKIQEPVEVHKTAEIQPVHMSSPQQRVPRRASLGAPTTPPRLSLAPPAPDDEHLALLNLPSTQYCNVGSLPPAVDRNLKPRTPSYSQPQTSALSAAHARPQPEQRSAATLQYLDLDLHTDTKPPDSKDSDGIRRRDVIHGKGAAGNDADCAYKTVDFVKTEAFNITRQDAEASRLYQH